MSKESPIGPQGPDRSHFRQLSAGSVEGAAGRRGAGHRDANVFSDNEELAASAQSASLLGLERAVASTSESARMLDKMRVALEEVSQANKAAAQARAPDVDVAAQAAEMLSNQEGSAECGKANADRTKCAPKAWQGLLG
jgi:hypothetical protein